MWKKCEKTRMELPKDSLLKDTGSPVVLSLLAVLALEAGRLYG